MKKTSVKVEDKENHPLHHLYLASEAILNAHKNALVKLDKNPNSDQTIPIFLLAPNGVIKVTIEVGSEVEAEYAIMKASSEH